MRAPGPVHQPWWCAALLLLASSKGHAESEPGKEPVRVRMALTASAETSTCVRPRVISKRTEANLRRPVFTRDPDLGDVSLALDVIEQSPPSATLALSESATGANLGHRRLEAATCAELEASVVLTLTLMLDFERAEMTAKKDAAAALAATDAKVEDSSPVASTGASPVPEPSAPSSTSIPAAEVAPAPTTETPVDPSPEHADDDRTPAVEESNADRWTLDASAEGRSGWGWAPKTELGVGAAVGASLDETFRAELGVGLWQTQTFARLGGELELSRRNLHLALSPWALRRGRWLVRASALATLEQVRAEGSGYPSNQIAETLSGGVGVVGSVDYSLTRVLFARVGAQVTAPIRAADYVLSAPDAPQTAFSVAPVTAGLALGLGLKSP